MICKLVAGHRYPIPEALELPGAKSALHLAQPQCPSSHHIYVAYWQNDKVSATRGFEEPVFDDPPEPAGVFRDQFQGRSRVCADSI